MPLLTHIKLDEFLDFHARRGEGAMTIAAGTFAFAPSPPRMMGGWNLFWFEAGIVSRDALRLLVELDRDLLVLSVRQPAMPS